MQHILLVPLLAQLSPPVLPRFDQLPPPLPLPETIPIPPLETIPTPTPTPELPTIPGTIKVIGFEFIGNDSKVFTEEQLQKVVQPYLGEITFTQLLAAEAAVTKLYTDAGYLNSGAVILAGQTFKRDEAVITICIIEGGIEDIQVTVTGRLNPNYIKNRLALATQTPLNQNRLLEALQLLQLDPLVENISARLSTGVRPELSLLEVEVTEADTFDLTAIADNGRIASVGSFRRGVILNPRNLFGIGDNFRFEYTNTDGSNTYDLLYQIPVNPRNGKVTLATRFSDSRIITSPFDALDIKGETLYVDLGFSQPIIQTPTQELALSLVASRISNKSTILGVGFPLSVGADDQGETNISALRLSQQWTKRNPQDILVLRSQFSLGLDVFNATNNADAPDSQFFAWRVQTQYVRLLAPSALLVVRSDIQLSADALLAWERFSLGGIYSVRGYPQDILLVDNGVFFSTEVRLPVFTAKKINGVLQIVPFLDFGVGWNHPDANPVDTNTLIGIGLGLNWQVGDNFNARFDYGIPLTDLDYNRDNWQENGLYFTLSYTFF